MEALADISLFRGYSRATAGGGAIVKSTKGGGGTTRSTTSGGGTTATSSSGGGTSKSTASGGGSTQSSSAGGGTTRSTTGKTFGQIPVTTESPIGGDTGSNHKHRAYLDGSLWNHNHSVTIPSHSHNVSIPSHTHSFSTPNHRHNVTIPSHSHDVTIPSHTHEIELPNHTHNVKHQIVELSETPSSVEIRIDGNLVPFDSTSGDRIDLADYIEKDTNGKIRRGRHELTISPDGLARIEADLILRVFIQSTIGVTL